MIPFWSWGKGCNLWELLIIYIQVFFIVRGGMFSPGLQKDMVIKMKHSGKVKGNIGQNTLCKCWLSKALCTKYTMYILDVTMCMLVVSKTSGTTYNIETKLLTHVYWSIEKRSEENLPLPLALFR